MTGAFTGSRTSAGEGLAGRSTAWIGRTATCGGLERPNGSLEWPDGGLERLDEVDDGLEGPDEADDGLGRAGRRPRRAGLGQTAAWMS